MSITLRTLIALLWVSATGEAKQGLATTEQAQTVMHEINESATCLKLPPIWVSRTAAARKDKTVKLEPYQYLIQSTIYDSISHVQKEKKKRKQKKPYLHYRAAYIWYNAGLCHTPHLWRGLFFYLLYSSLQSSTCHFNSFFYSKRKHTHAHKSTQE